MALDLRLVSEKDLELSLNGIRSITAEKVSGGKEIDSVAFSKHIEECMIRGKSMITFVIGGSLGLGKSLLQRADYRLCFSKMTFPHQLMKLILVEQVYRAFKIMRRETYHK